MKQANRRSKKVSDTPIPKPTGSLLQDFLRSTEARFVTKRLPKEVAGDSKPMTERYRKDEVEH